jgi:hypothetical protein
MSYDLIKKYEKLLGPFPPWKFCFDISGWKRYPDRVYFDWELIKFEEKNKDKIPKTPGIYAFLIKPDIAGIPQNAYLLYIGKAGDKSKNNLYKRFNQYLNGLKYSKRPKLTVALNKWKKYVYFCYAEVTDLRLSLSKIETDLNDALIPPLNENDFSVEIKIMKKVLR